MADILTDIRHGRLAPTIAGFQNTYGLTPRQSAAVWQALWAYTADQFDLALSDEFERIADAEAAEARWELEIERRMSEPGEWPQHYMPEDPRERGWLGADEPW